MHKLFLILALLLAYTSSYAQNIALIIGNQNYRSSGSLQTPINDAKQIASKLRGVDFHVAVQTDIKTRHDFIEVLKNFATRSRSADIALIYYAGHSIEAWGEFYLLPTNAPAIRSTKDLQHLVDYNDLETAVSNARITGILSLDACRNNPLDLLQRQTSRNARAIFSHDRQHRGLPDIRGLKRPRQASNRKPVNLLTSFATAPKDIAFDRYKKTQHSPYAFAFLSELNNPNREIGQIFRSLRSRVMQLTNNRQRPEIHEERDATTVYLKAGRRQYNSTFSAPRQYSRVRYLNGVSIDTGR